MFPRSYPGRYGPEAAMAGPGQHPIVRILIALVAWCALCPHAHAAPVRIELTAAVHAGERALLYRYLDLFTLRTELIGQAEVDADGKAVIEANVTGTVKAQLRIGGIHGGLWLRPGTYRITFPPPPPGTPRSLNGTTETILEFRDLDRMDVNALLADLNQRLDDFAMEEVATSRRLGKDTAGRPETLFLSPTKSPARTDSFALKLQGYYNGVRDPWFLQNLEYGIAGLRFGPGVNDRELFGKYLKGRPVLYDVPEYVRFIQAFFDEHIMRYPFRKNEAALVNAVRAADPDSVRTLFAEHDLLKDDALCELVMLMGLHAQYPGKTFDRKGILGILDRVAATSMHPENRRIAANMLWDLTTMRPGGRLPPLVLRDLSGQQARIDTVLRGATCLVVTAAWCTYCEQELVALETLRKEYGQVINVVGISLDRSPQELEAYVHAHPDRDWPWYFGGDNAVIMDQLRIRTIPAFFLLNGDTLARAPAPPPSDGLAPLLHKLKVQWEEENKLRPDQGPPRRR